MSLSTQERSAYPKAIAQSAIDQLNVSIPVTVVAVNGDKVDIIPDIYRGPMLGDRTRNYTETTQINGIPVVNMGCAGFVIQIPIKPGCRGLYIHCDYDIDNWLDGSSKLPHTARTHDLNDGFFIPAFNGGRNDGNCLEIKSKNVTFKLCENGFDIIKNGQSFLSFLNGCCPGASNWQA